MNRDSLRPRLGRPVSSLRIENSTEIQVAQIPSPCTAPLTTPDPCHLLKLPAEILAQICLQSNIMDLKNMRLVNKIFAELAVKELFYEVYFMMLPESMSKLASIIDHPVLHRLVHSLVYFGDRFNRDLEDRDIWNIYCTAENPLGSACDDDFYRYFDMSTDHDEMLVDHKEPEFLTKIFSALSSVTKFTLAGFVGFDTDLQSDRPQDQVPIYPKLELDLLLNRSDMLVQGNSHNNKIVTYAVYSVLEALSNVFSSSRRSIKTVNLVDLPVEFITGNPHPTIYSLAESGLKLGASTVFSNTTLLNIELTMAELGHLSDGPEAPISQLARFLSLAPNLIDLSIMLYSYLDSGTGDALDMPVPIGPALASLHWVALKTLTLWNVEFTLVEFVGFMKNHASTLREVTLSNVKFVGDVSCGKDQQAEHSSSPWERAITTLAPAMHLTCISAIELGDDLTEKRIAAGDQNGFPITWLIEGHFAGLLYYLLQKGKTNFPEYGRPQIQGILGAKLFGMAYWGELEDFNKETNWKGMQSAMVKWDENFANAGNPVEELPEGKKFEDIFDERWRGGSGFSLRRVL